MAVEGICGSDCHFWQHGQIGPTMVVRDEVRAVVKDVLVREKMMPTISQTGAGHESAGEVLEVGEGVKDFKPGASRTHPNQA